MRNLGLDSKMKNNDLAAYPTVGFVVKGAAFWSLVKVLIQFP